MFFIIDKENRHLYEDELDQMFILRKKIFIDERKWDLPHENGREIDQFDTEGCDYILCFDEDGRVIAGSRFMSFSSPNLTKTVFGELLYDFEFDQSTIEMTRAFVRSDRRNGPYFGLFLCAKFEYLLWKRASWLIETLDARFMPMLLETGWNIKVIGRPASDENGSFVSIATPVEWRSLALPRKRFGVDQPLLYRLDEDNSADACMVA